MRAIDPESAPRIPPMADRAPMRTARAVTRMDYNAQGVTLSWDDGLRSRFHARWLRDNCPCSACRHPQALERTFMFVDEAVPSIASAVVGPDEVLEIQFRGAVESHAARFTKGWLRAHDYSESAAGAETYAPHLWGADIAGRLRRIAYSDYMKTCNGLRAWITAVKTDGVVLLRDVPTESGKLLDVARRIGPVRASNFGEYYDVVSLQNPNASAYTAMGLELHTDLANWRVPPDVQLLLCLKNNVIGGESVFADGFRVADDLRLADPVAFDLLSRHPIDYRFHDDSCDIRTRGSAIEVDRGGRLVRIRFNNWLRAALMVPEDLVEPMYEALGKFWRMLRDPGYHLNLRLEPGDLIAYNNNRVLHGRAPFDARSGERHLQGCYLNQEDVESALRLLDRLEA